MTIHQELERELVAWFGHLERLGQRRPELPMLVTVTQACYAELLDETVRADTRVGVVTVVFQ